MLSSFESLGRDAILTGRNVLICFSSRHYPIFDLERSLKFDLETQQGHTDDIIKFINIKLKPGRHPKAGELKERLQSRANGVFIWVALVINMLNKDLAQGRIYSVWGTLDKIPINLHVFFHDMTQNAESKDEHDDLLLSV